MHVKAFAKVNLGLEVTGKRVDGYHNIRTLFQSVDFCDSLTLAPTVQGRVELEGNDPSLPWDERNLVFRAAMALKERFRVSQGVKIRLDKAIPAGKGLGGGSSDAAVTLYALNKLWGLEADKHILVEIAKTLGADVPYFLEGGLCLGTGRGDELTPLDDLSQIFLVLALPDICVLSSTIYERLSPLTSRGKDSKITKFLDTLEFGILENSLEETVFSLHPQLKDIKRLFYRKESVLSLVSGSGAAVFGLFRHRERALEVCGQLKTEYPLRLVKSLSRAQYWDGIEAGV